MSDEPRRENPLHVDCSKYMSQYEIEFKDDGAARKVVEMMRRGKTFSEAVDWLELRANYHFIVTKL